MSFYGVYDLSRSSSSHCSTDSLFGGELCCLQHRKGYRFSIDAVILAHFVRMKKGCRLLDLGTGCGIIMLLLCYRHRNLLLEILGLEYQRGLADLARANIEQNDFSEYCRAVLGDVRQYSALVGAETFDVVVCNPPFYRLGHGRTSKDEEAFLARHQVSGSLEDFLKAGFYALKNRGTMYFIYPASQLVDCICCARRLGLEPKLIRFVYSYPDFGADASLALLSCTKNGGTSVEVMPPLFVYREKNGSYSREVSEYYLNNQDLRK